MEEGSRGAHRGVGEGSGARLQGLPRPFPSTARPSPDGPERRPDAVPSDSASAHRRDLERVPASPHFTEIKSPNASRPLPRAASGRLPEGWRRPGGEPAA